MQIFKRAYWDDIRIRYLDLKNPMEGIAIAPSEFDTQQGAVYELNGVKVTAFEVDHGVFIKPAYGYRVDYIAADRSSFPETRGSAENLDRACHRRKPHRA